jgi:hypothetical protein
VIGILRERRQVKLDAKRRVLPRRSWH